MTPVLDENVAVTKGILSIFCWTVLQTHQSNAAAEFLLRRDAEVSKLAPCEGLGSKEQKLWSIFQRNFVPPLTEAGPSRVTLRNPLMRGLYRQIWAAVLRLSPVILFLWRRRPEKHQSRKSSTARDLPWFFRKRNLFSHLFKWYS